jgi:hypothetical protein
LADADHWNAFGGLTLGVHELGHILFAPFGEWLTVAGGSITQLAAPIAAGFVFWRQRDWFGVAVAGTWESYSLANLSAYIADARAQALPLVSVGSSDEIIHDWNWLLGHARLLEWDTRLGRVATLLGALVLLASVILGVWACVRIANEPAATLPSPRPDV